VRRPVAKFLNAWTLLLLMLTGSGAQMRLSGTFVTEAYPSESQLAAETPVQPPAEPPSGKAGSGPPPSTGPINPENVGGSARTRFPASAPAASMPGSMGATTSAMPPEHRRARHLPAHKTIERHRPDNQAAGNIADRLNREELARLRRAMAPGAGAN
jgi:hypothetical protein